MPSDLADLLKSIIMNKFIDHQINKYADLPDNLEYETLDYEEVERRRRYTMLDRKRKLKRKIILCFLAIAVAIMYALCVYAFTFIMILYVIR